MKRTITMWAMFTPKNEMVSMDDTRKMLQNQASSWKLLYKNGYRCRKVTISWEE